MSSEPSASPGSTCIAQVRVPGGPAFELELQSRVDKFITRDLRSDGIWEPLETSVVRTILQPGCTFLDLGANIGYYTVLASLTCGEGGKVYAFEPDPGNYALLQRNVALNGLRNVTAVNAAVASTGGEARLFLSPDNQGDHRLYNDDSRAASITVPRVALDDWFAGRDRRIDVVKIDTQGYEVEILKGMRGLLDENRAHVRLVLEFWPYGLQGAGSSAADLIDLLEPYGFDVFRVDERLTAPVPTSWSALRYEAETFFAPSTRDFTNLLLQPRR